MEGIPHFRNQLENPQEKDLRNKSQQEYNQGIQRENHKRKQKNLLFTDKSYPQRNLKRNRFMSLGFKLMMMKITHPFGL